MQARDDGARAAVDDHRGVLGLERGMPAADQVARPGGEVLVRLVAILRSQRVTDERGQRLFVIVGGAAEHQAIAKVPDHPVLLPAAREGAA